MMIQFGKMSAYFVVLAAVSTTVGSLASLADDGVASPTFSKEDLQTVIPQLANDTGALGQDLTDGINEVIEKLGTPTGILVGTETQSSFFMGSRNGSGLLLFKGQETADAVPLFWKAPSLDMKTAKSDTHVTILVYGTHSLSPLLEPFVSIEGSPRAISGGDASLLQSTDTSPDGDGISVAYIGIGLGLDGDVAVQNLTLNTSSQ